jgi:PIN domain nuclease of toxin-antitoxin system
VECLLDTHALLWALTAPKSLSRKARSLIEDPTATLHVSAASAWEVATKHRLGKLPGAESIVSGFLRNLERLGALELPVGVSHGLLAGSLTWQHRDPFDRMIAAQCMLENLPLISKDAAFAELPGVRVVW